MLIPEIHLYVVLVNVRKYRVIEKDGWDLKPL
jgi:hypothetical protein